MHLHIRPRPQRAVAGLILQVVAFCASAPCLADGNSACCAQPRPQDQVWLVSCRGVGCGPLPERVARLQYWRYDRERAWVKASLAELTDTDDVEVTTTVFVHGNRISSDEAFTRGWLAYRTLMRCADERPVRFIMWSWPSDAERGLVNDVRVKAWHADPAGACLGWFLDQLNPDLQVSLWGHSFGARVVTAALHVLGGGAIGGDQIDERVHPTRLPMQAVLFAAAIDNDWLLKGHRHGEALSQVSLLLLVNNGCDAMLKRYRLIYCDHGCQQALGYTGLPSAWMSESDWSRVRQIDVANQVGNRHAFNTYLMAPDIIAQTRSVLLFENPNASVLPTSEISDVARNTASAPAK